MFIQVFQGPTEDPEALRARLDRWVAELAPGAEGWLGLTAGVTEEGEFISLVRFESEEAARRNSDRPEQGRWWGETEPLFSGEVSFHDYPNTALVFGGGSDEAGFVQVLQGRSSQPDRLLPDEKAAELLRSLRPEIIGTSMGWSEEGHFTEAVYFTSEEEARRGERETEDDPRLQSMREEWMGLMEEVRFLDLRRPWLISP